MNDMQFIYQNSSEISQGKKKNKQHKNKEHSIKSDLCYDYNLLSVKGTLENRNS